MNSLSESSWLRGAILVSMLVAAGAGLAVIEPWGFRTHTRFTPFGASHAVAFELVVVGIALILWHGKRLDHAGRCRFARRLAITILFIEVPVELALFWPAHFRLDWSLPFQLCDLAALLSAYALWTRKPWSAGILFYWALTMCGQALLTPAVLYFDFPHPHYLMFWARHGLIVAAALYLTFVLDIRPGWPDYFRAAGVTIGWAIAMGFVNANWGTNFLYIRAKPPGTLLDHLGPWPVYIFVASTIFALVWALLTVGVSRGAKPTRI